MDIQQPEAPAAKHGQLLPNYFVVNFAHNGLNKVAKEANVRIIGAFSTVQGAKSFCNIFTEKHKVDCFMVARGQPSLIPKDYAVIEMKPEDANAYVSDKISKIVQHHSEACKASHEEFQENKTRKKSYAADPTLFDKDVEMDKLLQLAEARKQEKEKAAAVMQAELFSVTGEAGVDTSMKGGFAFAAVSFLPDITTSNPSEQEHCMYIHNAFESIAEGKSYIAKHLEHEIHDHNIYVLDMYQWLQPSVAFSNFAMDHIPTKYRNSTQNEIMQYKMNGAHAKINELQNKYKTNLPLHEIKDGVPDVHSDSDECELSVD